MTAAYDQPSYTIGEKITVTVTVKNAGTEPITTRGYFPWRSDAITLVPETNPFANLTLAPGASVSHDLTGAVGNAKLTAARLYVSFGSGADQREFSFPVTISLTYGRATGTVYFDENDNGKFDTGEGVAGASLSWNNRLYSGTKVHTETNATGRFSVDVPTGPYYVLGDLPGDLLMDVHDVAVPASGVDGLLFEAVRPLNTLLAVTTEFTKDTYKKTDTPAVKVTLTNKGDLPLPKIVANCDQGPDTPNLTGKGAGWGGLAGEGVTIAPHSTTVIDVTERMPALAHDFGYVGVDCVFGQAGVDYGANPRASDEAKVPGQTADVTVTIGSFTEGASLSGFHVMLTEGKDQCPVIAKATTGADGRATLKAVPAGHYHLYVVPPTKKWWFKHGNQSGAQVTANRDNNFVFVAGVQNEDNANLATPPNCPGTNTPSPQGSTGSGLAYTGASLVVPGLAGLVALLAGIGLLLLTRKRATS